MKDKQLAFRVDQDTYDWLADEAIKSQRSMSDVVRGIFEANKMSQATRKGYKVCLEYLAALEPHEFLDGLDALRDAIREKTNG